MDGCVRLSAWSVSCRPLSWRHGRNLFLAHMERVSWLAKPLGFTSPSTKTANCNASPRRTRLPRHWSFERGWCCVAPRATSRPMTRSPRTSAATRTRCPNGAAVSSSSGWKACLISRARAGPGLFPPEDRHKVLTLATTAPADVGLPASHWSLDNLAFHILKDAHYRDMSRSTLQRVLAEAELRPHKSRYWLHSNDPDFETKVLDICQLYLDAPRLYAHGELVLCVD